MQGTFLIHNPTGSGNTNTTTTNYTVGTPSNSYGATQGTQIGLFAYTGGNIPTGTTGTLTIGSNTYTGTFNGSGAFVPDSGQILNPSTTTGSQSFVITTTGTLPNATTSPVNYSGNILILASNTSNTYSFGTATNTPITVQTNGTIPVISFTGGNIPTGTLTTLSIPTSTGTVVINGATDATGAFVPNAGQTIPSNATVGSQSFVLSTSGLSPNTTVNVSGIVSMSPTVTELGKSLVFGVNGNQYTLVDTNTGALISSSVNTIAGYVGGNYTKQVARNASGNTLYQLCQGFGLVSLAFNNTTNVLSYTSNLPIANSTSLYGMAYSESKDLIFTCGRSNTNKLIVSVIRASTMTLLNTLNYTTHEYASGECAYDSVNDFLYVNGRRTGGEASVIRTTINTTTGGGSNDKQWDYAGSGSMGSGLALNQDNSKLVVGIQLSPITNNVYILNTSVFNGSASIYSFQGASIGLGSNTTPTVSMQGASLDVRNIDCQGNKFVVGYGAGVSQTSTGDTTLTTLTNYPSPAYSETVGLTPTGSKFAQLGYNSGICQIRTFAGVAVGGTVSVVANPLAIICL